MNQKEFVLQPEEAFDAEQLQRALCARLHAGEDETVRVLKRSVDARGRRVAVHVLAETVKKADASIGFRRDYRDVSSAPSVIVVGSGPAGLFAALRLIELGFKPIVFERGKDVQARRRDLAAINKHHIVNSESNYCFGEGGAGTYSDGKLYTRSKKRGDIRRILEILVAHGATDEILFDAHPHIGTNKLPKLVAALRESILHAGGEIHFNAKVTDLLIEQGSASGVVLADGSQHQAEAIILATGHSARDVYELLHRKGIHIEAKPFAIGVRVEHQQRLIDRIQYHCEVDRGLYLPASSYALVHQAMVRAEQRGVFSFCMCPGGFVVPAATAPGEVVVNGMSPSRRDSKFANSGIVTAVDVKDFSDFQHHGPLAGMHFQASIEQRACILAGGTQAAPAQRLIDFVEKRASATLLPTSYQPGLVAVDMEQVFPSLITDALRQGFKAFGQKMRGYLTNDAQVIGVESRTSAPVRIPRDKETLEHVQVRHLYPCGEGAGYAGGIVSAAMDGERCAEAVAQKVRR